MEDEAKKFEQALAVMAEYEARIAEDDGQYSVAIQNANEAWKKLEASLITMVKNQARVAEARAKHEAQVARSVLANRMAQVAQIKTMVAEMDANVVYAQVRYNRALRAANVLPEKQAAASRAAQEAAEAEETARLAVESAKSNLGNPEVEEENLIVKSHTEALQSAVAAQCAQSFAALEDAAIERSELNVARIELEDAKEKAFITLKYLEYAEITLATGVPLNSISDFLRPIQDAKDSDAEVPVESNADATTEDTSTSCSTVSKNIMDDLCFSEADWERVQLRTQGLTY